METYTIASCPAIVNGSPDYIPMIEPGDIFGCYSEGFISKTISLMTIGLTQPRWPPSHVGIALHDEEGKIKWFESTSLSSQNGVQCHTIDDGLKKHKKVVVYRLTKFNELTIAEATLLSQLAVKALGTGYDLTSAILSGTRLISNTGLMPKADSTALFCSEFVALLLVAIYKLNRDNYSRYNPGRLLRKLIQTGVYTSTLTIETI